MRITKKWLTAGRSEDGKIETRIHREQVEDDGVRTFETEIATQEQLHQWPSIMCPDCGTVFPAIVVNDKPVLPHHGKCRKG